MAAVALTLRSIPDLYDGAAEKIIDRAIAAAISDLDDRAHEDGKAREVHIKLILTPVENSPQVSIGVEATTKLPNYRTPPTFAQIRAAGDGEQRLMFQEFDPKDPEQRTMDEAARANG